MKVGRWRGGWRGGRNRREGGNGSDEKVMRRRG